MAWAYGKELREYCSHPIVHAFPSEVMRDAWLKRTRANRKIKSLCKEMSKAEADELCRDSWRKRSGPVVHRMLVGCNRV